MKAGPVKDDLFRFDHFIQAPRGHAQGSWGYTVLRTAYSAESDALVPLTLDRLKRYMHYFCHYGRFLGLGALCEEWRVDFSGPNEESCSAGSIWSSSRTAKVWRISTATGMTAGRLLPTACRWRRDGWVSRGQPPLLRLSRPQSRQRGIAG